MTNLASNGESAGFPYYLGENRCSAPSYGVGPAARCSSRRTETSPDRRIEVPSVPPR